MEMGNKLKITLKLKFLTAEKWKCLLLMCISDVQISNIYTNKPLVHMPLHAINSWQICQQVKLTSCNMKIKL